MQQVHYVNYVSVVLVEGLSRRELLDGIYTEDYEKCGDIEKQERRNEIINRLRKLIPAFVDETAQVKDNLSLNINYNISLPNGRLEASLSIDADLGEYLLNYSGIVGCNENSKRDEIADKFNGRSGVVIKAYYHWGGNKGRGLQLGRFRNPPALSFSSDYESMAFENAINALCRGIDLTEEVVRTEKLFSTPLSYCDGTTEVDALVRNVSLEAIRAADQPVSEFMAWMQENAVQVNTMGELARLAQHSYLAAQKHERRANMGRVSSALPVTVKKMGDGYLKLAQEAASELQPPQNNRMDYLVH